MGGPRLPAGGPRGRSPAKPAARRIARARSRWAAAAAALAAAAVLLAEPAAPQLVVSPKQYWNVRARNLLYTRDVAPCSNYPVSQDRRCGPDNGFTQCPTGQCCSRWGWCSGPDAPNPTEDYCAQERGCLLGFGTCWGTGTPYCIQDLGSMSPPCPNYPIAPLDRCGADFGYVRCPDGQCCSKWNFCSGPGAPDSLWQYCDVNQGCQLGFGSCWGNQGLYCRANIDQPDARPTWSFLPPTGTTQTTSPTGTGTGTGTTKTNTATGSGTQERPRTTTTRRTTTNNLTPTFSPDERPTTTTRRVTTGLLPRTTTTPTLTLTPNEETTTQPRTTAKGTPTLQVTSTVTVQRPTTTASQTVVTATFTADPFFPLTTNGTCGQAWDVRCPDNICCSQRGACQDDGGTDGEAWCGEGCQIGYGKCWAAVVQRGQRCGAAANGASCPPNICCSATGFCQDDGGAAGEEWCGCGCQQQYGTCFGRTPEECGSTVVARTTTQAGNATTAGGTTAAGTTAGQPTETLTPEPATTARTTTAPAATTAGEPTETLTPEPTTAGGTTAGGTTAGTAGGTTAGGTTAGTAGGTTASLNPDENITPTTGGATTAPGTTAAETETLAPA
ncbi:hypothetical protein DFJ74DRAFT_124023 [Hyaloraphidium curvatum]|nr:hypothetical protein DFJ74DRAFT_124023 [Hyaloraphidium curvatum]